MTDYDELLARLDDFKVLPGLAECAAAIRSLEADLQAERRKNKSADEHWRFWKSRADEAWIQLSATDGKLMGPVSLRDQLEAERKAHALADKVVIEFQDRFLKERKAREEADSNYIAARHEAMREASICAEALSRAEAAERRLATVEAMTIDRCAKIVEVTSGLGFRSGTFTVGSQGNDVLKARAEEIRALTPAAENEGIKKGEKR